MPTISPFRRVFTVLDLCPIIKLAPRGILPQCYSGDAQKGVWSMKQGQRLLSILGFVPAILLMNSECVFGQRNIHERE